MREPLKQIDDDLRAIRRHVNIIRVVVVAQVLVVLALLVALVGEALR